MTALEMWVTAGGLLRPRPEVTFAMQLVWFQVVERERELEQRNADMARRDKELVDWERDTVKASAKQFASKR